MPADGAKQSSSSREQRRQRRNPEDAAEGSSHVREIELKRSRGEISCAECRRLKIKCDKKLPCSSCLRRGCAALCPNGSLSTGQGTRFVMAATDHLHRRMAKMSERIRQLEDALSILHKRTTNELEPHPLLRDEYLAIKAHKADETPDDRKQDGPDATDVIDAFGTLSITDRGISRFFGAAGGTESLLHDGDDDLSVSSRYSSPSSKSKSKSQSSSKSPPLPPDITRFSSAFPFTPLGAPQAIQDMIRAYLPPYPRALELSRTYLEQAGWLFHAISRAQLVDEMLPVIYKKQAPSDPAHEYAGPHDLAVVFMVFAVGALVDLNQEPYNAEAEHYYQLAKAAVCLQNVLETPELTTIQALHLMSIYNAMSQNDMVGSGSDTSMELSWSLIRLSMQLSQIIGLHRDSSRWGLNQKDVQRRRALFWDLFVAEAWQALSTGRPPSITTPYFDCQFPTDEEQGVNNEGKPEPGYSSWGFRFASECVAEVAAKTLTAQVPSYQTILELDRVVREFPLPELPSEMPFNPEKPAMTMIRYVLSHSREVILLCIHRSFFAQAMIDDPVDPLRSPFAPSFLAAYRCASHILLSIKEQFDLLPELCSRFWATWTYAFSAAIVFGTIVTRGPTSSMAQTAMTELDQACDLFAKAAVHSRRAAKALIVLRKLQSKAHQALDLSYKLKIEPHLDHTPFVRTQKQEDEDELAIFGGRTRLVGPKGSTKSSPTPSSSAAASSSSRPEIILRPEHRVPSQGPATYIHTHTTQHIQEGTTSDWSSPTSATSQHHFFTHDASPYSHPPPQPTIAIPSIIPSRLDTATPSYSNLAHSREKMSWASSAPAQINPSARSLPPPRPSIYRSAPPPPLHALHPLHDDYRGFSLHYPGHASAHPHPHQPQSQSHHHQQQQQQQQQQHSPTLPSPSPSHSQHPQYGGYYNPPTPGPASSNPGHLTPSPVFASSQQQHQHQQQYTPAPREFAEMGLASQGSGMNQQWTSFMTDSGVFYENQL